MSPSVVDLLRSATALHAATLWQPWAWAVGEAGKDVENRGWAPPAARVGGLLAVHAGLRYDEGSAESIREAFGLQVPGTCVQGAVVAVALLARAVRDSSSRWAVPGRVHWCLEGTVRLERPVPCKGAQGLWLLPPRVFAEVREQVLAVVADPPAQEAVSATRLSSRAWSKGSARNAGPAQQVGAVRVGVVQILPCRDCGRPVRWYGTPPGPRHGFNRIRLGGAGGREDCVGQPAPAEEEGAT